MLRSTHKKQILDKKLIVGRMRRVEICGGIASGKTTLARLLQRHGFEAVFENFQQNPFWAAFYERPDEVAVETEITFLLQHYHDAFTARRCKNIVACDFSFTLDRSYADVTLDADGKSAFLAVYGYVRRAIGTPNLLVHLTCSASEELRRIERRRRKEERGVRVGYLKQLNRQISRNVMRDQDETCVVTIDSARLDFTEAGTMQGDVVDLIRRALV